MDIQQIAQYRPGEMGTGTDDLRVLSILSLSGSVFMIRCCVQVLCAGVVQVLCRCCAAGVVG